MSTPVETPPGRPAAAAPARAGWPRLLRRRPWERVSMTLIGLGAVLLMQPVSIELFGHSFVVLLAGVVGYTIAGKLP
jgi:hypothetical protein